MGWFSPVPHDCKIHGHAYQARYDMKMPEDFYFEDITSSRMAEVIKDKIYLFDICVICGNKVNRDVP